MRRPAKGGTTHPTQPRPGMGFGRPLRPQPGPRAGGNVLVEVYAFLRGEPVTTVDDTVTHADRAPVGELDLQS
jgi:hypothetical protein